MPIPEIESFQEFLSSLTFNPVGDATDFEQIEVVPERVLSNDAGFFAASPVALWGGKELRISSAAILEKIRKELGRLGHVSTIDAARLLLAMFCMTWRGKGSAVGRLNEIIASIGAADSTQFLIAPFPPRPEMLPFQVGRFRVGPLDRTRLVYRCEKVDCDFFERYSDQFPNQFAIEGGLVPVQVLDWHCVRDRLVARFEKVATTIVNYYFDVVTASLRESFIREFRESQEIAVAAGAPGIDVEEPWLWNGASFIGIFQNIGRTRWGYFCPFGMKAGLNWGSVDTRLPEKLRELSDIFSLTSLGDSEIHQTLGTYAKFVAKARIHWGAGRNNEAFLHFVIALDLLFSEKEASTQSISKRTAIVVCKVLGESFEDSLQRVKMLYDKRSRYVHGGVSVTQADLELVEPVTLEVLLCLLRLQANTENHRKGFIADWWRDLDYLAAALQAGKEIRDEELITSGIAVEQRAVR